MNALSGAESVSGHLRRGVLGPAQIAFFVISAAGPLVAMAGGIPIAMLFGNGPAIPAMFLFASLILIAFAVAYTAMAREVRSAGAFYAFAARGLGRRAAGATGLLALLSYNAIQIGLYGLFGSAAQMLVASLTGAHLPWWLYAAGALILVSYFGYRQVDLSARVLGVLVAAEYLVVLILVIGIMAAGGQSGLSLRPFSPGLVMTGSPAIGLMLCFAAFIGFEATTIYSEEARDPDRTIPLATYISVLLIGGFYTLSTWAVVNGAGVDQLLPSLLKAQDPTSLLFDLSDHFVGPWLSLIMRVLFVTSCFASLLAFHNAIARYLFSMGREGLLPRKLGHTHQVHASPSAGSVVQTCLAALCLGSFAIGNADPVLSVFTLLSAVATLGIIILMAIASAAALFFFARKPDNRTATLFSAVALGSFLLIAALATIRFDVLAGGDLGPIARLLPAILAASAAVGVMLALRLRRSDPQAYAMLGRNREG